MASGDTNGQVVVVGAGIIGIACAHYLAKAGMKLSVFDRNTVAGACSHGNCGFIIPSHVLPLTGLLLKKLMLGRTPHIDPIPYSPARFQ